MKEHTFKDSLTVGEQGEAVLDAYWKKFYDIIPVTMAEQRLGIDRIFVNKISRFCYSVEYKTDFRTIQTGNVFIETWSSVNVKRGWGYTSLAQMLVYYVAEPGSIGTAYSLTTITLKNALSEWLAGEKYNTAEVANGSYTSAGLLVPLADFKQLAHKEDIVPWPKT